MHELSIAESILDAVREEARKYPSGHVSKVTVRVGELSGVSPDSLSFSFEALVSGTEMEPLALEIEFCPIRYKCGGCGATFALEMEKSPCPACGSTSSSFAGGDELDIAYLEVDDGAPAT